MIDLVPFVSDILFLYFASLRIDADRQRQVAGLSVARNHRSPEGHHRRLSLVGPHKRSGSNFIQKDLKSFGYWYLLVLIL